jgi:hypothetical protein
MTAASTGRSETLASSYSKVPTGRLADASSPGITGVSCSSRTRTGISGSEYSNHALGNSAR